MKVTVSLASLFFEAIKELSYLAEKKCPFYALEKDEKDKIERFAREAFRISKEHILNYINEELKDESFYGC